MSKRLELQQLFSGLRYQLQPIVSTWGHCPRCDSPSRGSNLCEQCLKDDIADLMGEQVPEDSLLFLLNALTDHFRVYRDIEERLLGLAEKTK